MTPQKICRRCGLSKPLREFTVGVAQCKPCRAAATQLWREINPEKRKESELRTRERRRDKARAYALAWNKAHPERKRENQRRYAAKNAEAYKARSRRWSKDNLARKLAHNKIREKRVRQATPPWVKREEIVAIYLARPDGYHVDHIFALRGRTADGYPFCGLNVPWNLQYLSAEANLRKHARLPPTESPAAFISLPHRRPQP